jgi:hypothetical protein
LAQNSMSIVGQANDGEFEGKVHHSVFVGAQKSHFGSDLDDHFQLVSYRHMVNVDLVISAALLGCGPRNLNLAVFQAGHVSLLLQGHSLPVHQDSGHVSAFISPFGTLSRLQRDGVLSPENTDLANPCQGLVSIVAPYVEPSVIEHVDVHFGIGYEAVVLSRDAWANKENGIAEYRKRGTEDEKDGTGRKP